MLLNWRRRKEDFSREESSSLSHRSDGCLSFSRFYSCNSQNWGVGLMAECQELFRRFISFSIFCYREHSTSWIMETKKAKQECDFDNLRGEKILLNCQFHFAPRGPSERKKMSRKNRFLSKFDFRSSTPALYGKQSPNWDEWIEILRSFRVRTGLDEGWVSGLNQKLSTVVNGDFNFHPSRWQLLELLCWPWQPQM